MAAPATRLARRAALALGLFVAAPALAQSWAQLTPQQRAALAPLERDWAGMDAERRLKWLDIAGRMPRMSPEERERIQARMGEWSRMSPEERGRARQRYQAARDVDAEERQRRWEAYQQLPAERRRELSQAARPSRAAEPPPQRKANVVPNPATLPPPKQVAPSVLQGRPGATTTLMSRPPQPPPHQQAGMPKIAVQPGLVDRSTLLPQRGPQGAAAQPPAPEPSPPKGNRR